MMQYIVCRILLNSAIKLEIKGSVHIIIKFLELNKMFPSLGTGINILPYLPNLYEVSNYINQ